MEMLLWTNPNVPQATLGFTTSLEIQSFIGWMDRIYWEISKKMVVNLSKKQLESKFIALPYVFLLGETTIVPQGTLGFTSSLGNKSFIGWIDRIYWEISK